MSMFTSRRGLHLALALLAVFLMVAPLTLQAQDSGSDAVLTVPEQSTRATSTHL